MPPRRSPTPAIGFSPTAMQKELQCTIAIAALDTINKGPTTTLKKIMEKMEILVHCNPNIADSIHYTDHLLAGRGAYEHLWNKEGLVVNAAYNVDCGVDAYDLILDQEYSQNTERLIVGKDFTSTSLKNSSLQASSGLITGCTITKWDKVF